MTKSATKPKQRGQKPLIAVMGPTGSGKSHFIDTLVGTAKLAGNSLKFVTSKVRDIEVTISTSNESSIDIILVDTPGFDDTHNSDTVTLSVIADWMERKYRKRNTLSGILYLHRITDNRMAGTPLRNLRMFGKLCGGEKEVGNKIMFVTTNWDRLRDQSRGASRDAELQQYWQPMVDRGARCSQFRNTKKSACQIISDLLQSKFSERGLLLQEEMVDRELSLNETEAAQTLYSQYQTLLTQHKATLLDLEKAAKNSQDPSMHTDLEAERSRVQAELNKTFEEAKALKVGKLKRWLRIFHKKAGVELGAVGTSRS
ncbi:P-loop containing nucleoside triphosphate hydrolase protein [Crepidotus variabilis]|uniref:P-loop containing nucleoside triphosphate hydrolase protein n=1 Tax=Crepidotus variabilis TaxID=179855 RepID=A0A9P6JV36_9AGAR|nr:P-loop containing nucleoside triphosphate hydrolase protein [Crepidotus variabilis]